MSAAEYVSAAAQRAASARLERAVRLIELRARRPLFQVNDGRNAVRFDLPGVVTVFDRKTGEVLARSLPGRLLELDITPDR